ncbi:MAG: glycosyltransferase family 2 protein [Candidatus Sumerlaeaceae bacterium]|nr:glycosyltransferase family 2 protein [Candidatus Sumerlaeaceae bacterium]
MPSVSVVVLSYNSADYIGPCLQSIALSDYAPTEVVVVDNASKDDSVSEAREAAARAGLKIKLVALKQNLGCAGGNNAGWRETAGEYVVFLNPDTEITHDCLRQMIAPMITDSGIGATGAKIYYPGTRRIQHAGGAIGFNGMTNHFGAGEEDSGLYNEVRDVDYVTGAALAVRGRVVKELNGFDEDFFPAYFEETDFCTRIRKAGHRVVYIPTAVLYHHESVSLAANSPRFRRLYQKMRVLYCMKSYGRDFWRIFPKAELDWMCYEPKARGYRLEQVRAWFEAGAWWLRCKFARRRARG